MKKFLSLLVVVSLIFLGCPNPSDTSGKITYDVNISIDKSDEYANFNAHVYKYHNKKREFIRDYEITVKGEKLELGESDNYYYFYEDKIEDGEEIAYTIKTSDGKETSGSIIMPTGVVGDVTFSPDKLDTKYTFSHSTGTWPKGSAVKAEWLVRVDGNPSNWASYGEKSESSDEIVVYTHNGKDAEKIEFFTFLQEKIKLEDFSINSNVIARNKPIKVGEISKE